jgi:hypothetical protein
VDIPEGIANIRAHRNFARIVMTSLFLIAQKWKDPETYQGVNGQMKCDIATSGILFSHKKE